jgi:transcriptional regulator with XRE-family HTH domain
MDKDKSQVFLNWLTLKLQERNLTEHQLAKKAGIGHSIFTRARTKGIVPKWETVYKIARALDVSVYEAFRAAGLIPPLPQYKHQERIESMMERLDSVPEERWDFVSEIVDLVIKESERQKK